METNGPWNWRLTGPKTIKMTLVRPPMTHLKVRDDCAVSACSPLAPKTSVKALAHWLPVVVVGSWPLDRRLPPSLWAAGIWNKANFPFHQRGLFIGVASSRTPHSFGNRITEETRILSILLTEYVFTGTINKCFIKKKKLQSYYHQNFFFF